ncbi:hypothetical protein ACPPVU_03430 [Mucilaginibacter sp. McL0603]|uniref:hypothetical protein n=1 Tax=Mucilaginibacter sp. McL0603 TaxID=3415670 RepID=UPI003CE81469
MRNKSIKEELEEASELIDVLKTQETDALNNEEVLKLRSPKIVSALSHCRICLDYSTHDIEDVLISEANKKGIVLKPKEKLYFPYVTEQKRFNKRVNEILPNLKTYLPDVYNLLESIQPYNQPRNEQWLINMIDLNNSTKHFGEKEQAKQMVSSVDIGNGAIVIDNSHNIQLNNVTVNGVTQDSTFNLGEGEILAQPSNWDIQFEPFAKFKFKESDIFITRLLDNSLAGVDKYTDELYKLLVNY